MSYTVTPDSIIGDILDADMDSQRDIGKMPAWTKLNWSKL